MTRLVSWTSGSSGWEAHSYSGIETFSHPGMVFLGDIQGTVINFVECLNINNVRSFVDWQNCIEIRQGEQTFLEKDTISLTSCLTVFPSWLFTAVGRRQCWRLLSRTERFAGGWRNTIPRGYCSAAIVCHLHLGSLLFR